MCGTWEKALKQNLGLSDDPTKQNNNLELGIQTLPTIPPVPDIELTPLKTSAPTSRIASPALIKGSVKEILRFRGEGFWWAIRDGVV